MTILTRLLTLSPSTPIDCLWSGQNVTKERFLAFIKHSLLLVTEISVDTSYLSSFLLYSTRDPSRGHDLGTLSNPLRKLHSAAKNKRKRRKWKWNLLHWYNTVWHQWHAVCRTLCRQQEPSKNATTLHDPWETAHYWELNPSSVFPWEGRLPLFCVTDDLLCWKSSSLLDMVDPGEGRKRWSCWCEKGELPTQMRPMLFISSSSLLRAWFMTMRVQGFCRVFLHFTWPPEGKFIEVVKNSFSSDNYPERKVCRVLFTVGGWTVWFVLKIVGLLSERSAWHFEFLIFRIYLPKSVMTFKELRTATTSWEK